MKLLMISSSAGLGLTYHLTNLCLELKKIEVDVHVVTNGHEQWPGLTNRLISNGISVTAIHSIDRLSPVGWIYSAKCIIELISDHRIEVIHVHGLSQLPAVAMAKVLSSRRFRPKVVITLHDHAAYGTVKGRIAMRVLKRFVDRFIVLCESTNKKLTSSGIPFSKIYLVPNGVDLASYDMLARDVSYPPIETNGRKVVAYLAIMRPLKGHQYLLEAIRSVARVHPEVLLLLVGDGPRRSELETMIEEMGIKEYVKFTGMVPADALPALLKTIDIGVSSSLTEQFPTSILEIMAAGKPVVATPVGGIPAMVREGETGFLIPVTDSKTMASRITRLLENEVMARDFGKRGRKLVELEFNLPTIALKNSEIYEDLIREEVNRRK